MKKLISSFLALSMALGLSAGITLPVSAAESDSAADAEDTVTLSEFLAEAEGAEEGEDAIDQLYASFKSGYNEDGSVDTSIYDYDESQVSDSVETLEDEEYPNTFDLRHVDGKITYDSETKKNVITGGTSYVTPVKLQNPWGTCWAFGITAASETSILYESKQGTETVDNDTIDMSEHHLSWFAKNHIPAEGEEGYGVNDVNNQDGEGTVYDAGLSSSSMEGGFPFYGTSIYAAGEGIVSEETVPYYGTKKEVMARRKNSADQKVYTERYLYYPSVEAWEAETDEDIKANYYLFCYSKNDNWILDESLRFKQDYALEESSILPAAAGTANAETGQITLNEDGIEAIKAELSAGRAVNICYYADSSDPNADVTLNTSRYINSNYAHYCWDRTAANHSVCIVGWDDDYDASNFGQAHPAKYDSYGRVVYKLKDSDQELTYDTDGNLYYVDEDDTKHIYKTTSSLIELAREEDGSASVPAGNGAWIVKNSWGAATNEFPNYNEWGVDNSGYFYLSYYDTSLTYAESFDFVVTDEEQEEYSEYEIIDQYDYLTATNSTQSTAYAPVMMANVFTADEDMQIKAVSCETTTPGTTVIYGICLLDDDEECPQGDDEIISSEAVSYEYGGYHRQELAEPVTVAEGQKYAVIAMQFYISQDAKGDVSTKYFVCSNIGMSKELSDHFGYGLYNKGVINPGESYILSYGYNSEELISTDYYNYISNSKNLDPSGIVYQYDNFSIKAYATPVEIMYRLYNPNSGEHLYTSSTEEIENLTALGWQNEGEAWVAPETSETPVYRLYNPNNGDHHYTVYKDEVAELTEIGWVDEGIAWYSGGDATIYRLFNPNALSATHHYTGLKAEIDSLVELGWKDEGEAWYAISVPTIVAE